MREAIAQSAAGQAAVSGLYAQELGRAPDAAGLAGWQARLGTDMTLGQVRAAIAGLAEAAGDVQELSLYATGQAPTAAVVSGVQARMAQGESLSAAYLSMAALSLLGVLLVIHADFKTVRLTALVFVTLPFALIGGVFGAMLGGGVLSLGSLVGFVTVLGIAARNGIMLVSHYRHLEEEEGEPFGPDLVIRGSIERLAPILMTALATGLALVPLAIGGDKPGQEIEHPMAVVILGAWSPRPSSTSS